MLKKCSAAYEDRVLDFKGAMKKTKYPLIINLLGKVPEVIHKGKAVRRKQSYAQYLPCSGLGACPGHAGLLSAGCFLLPARFERLLWPEWQGHEIRPEQNAASVIVPLRKRLRALVLGLRRLARYVDGALAAAARNVPANVS